jgi:hypothetical protein
MNPDQKRTAEDRVVERALRALLPLFFQRHQALVKAGYKPKCEIAAYNDEASLRAMKPDEPQLTLSVQRRINQALVDELRSRGVQVALIRVKADEYFKWLDSYGLENTEGNRAQYVAWTTCPDRNSFQPNVSP